ncbi:hypothetical protein [Aromatoleum sp.]|uniref:hypothetical protein n=1 Tax=Aromatoleum sp. TaxID=2307007 RepID=UPI002FC802F1
MAPSTPTRTATFVRTVLPFAAIPPLMIVFAMRDHPEVYRLDPLSANWEWIALLVFVAELATVTLVAAMLRLTAPSSQSRPSPAQAYVFAARTASPLWASAIVLAVPSLAALVAAHLLAHVVALRSLHRDIRDQLKIADDLETLHVAYMVYSVAVVLWIPLVLMIFVSLSPA